MDLLQSAQTMLKQARVNYLSVPVTYTHYGATTVHVQLSACRGRSLFRAEDEYGVTIRVHTADFLVTASDLGLEPAKGDDIICDGHKYEVLAPNNEPVWRWSGTGTETMRIHTKDMGAVNG